MVDRRWFGVVVVVGVLLAAVVGANPLTRRVAGDPAPVTVSGAPSIGDCVTSLPTAERGADLDGTIDYPSAEYGPCNNPIVGEVSSVDQAIAPARQITGAEYWPLSAQCALDAIGYTGSIPPVVNQGGGRPGILWTPSLSFDYLPVGPSAVQRALGQHWSACVVGAVDATPYLGQLHQVLTGGVLPAVFGSCWPSAYLRSANQIPCDQPHPVELLGTTVLGGTSISTADVMAACVVYAGRVLRTADPTRQGVIALDVAGFDRVFEIQPTDDTNLAGRDVSCYAKAPTGSRFNGTLVGIGDGPLPLVR